MIKNGIFSESEKKARAPMHPEPILINVLLRQRWKIALSSVAYENEAGDVGNGTASSRSSSRMTLE